MDGDYYLVIVVTTIGFCALAAMLLVPIYRFLNKEEEVSRAWTKESLARQAQMDAIVDAAGDAGSDQPEPGPKPALSPDAET